MPRIGFGRRRALGSVGAGLSGSVGGSRPGWHSGGCFLLAAGSFAVKLLTGNGFAYLGMFYFGLLLLPLAMTFHQTGSRPRRPAATYTAAVALVGFSALATMVLGPASPLRGIASAGDLIQIFVIGAILSAWIPALAGGLGGSR